uniref:G_PROTEIN_RECEP_F1_2 domain-containing protein n=1 Tax=Angiostrongylus cantonensis TaxID=6313 RepID=A0A0K0DIH5_ANGCA
MRCQMKPSIFFFYRIRRKSVMSKLAFSTRIRALLVGLLLFSMVIGALVCRLSGFLKEFSDNDNAMMFSISCYIFYGIPLLSTVFYAMCFISLRSQRSLVCSDNTMSLLHQAERNTLKLGIVVLFFYLPGMMFPQILFCGQRLPPSVPVLGYPHFIIILAVVSTAENSNTVILEKNNKDVVTKKWD